jgi:uncharacterized protein YecE (DUF72 family)
VPRALLPEPDPQRLALASELAGAAALPARVGTVRFGTAGWTDPTLLKSKAFYPPKTSSAAERLRFYAKHFPLVEVDATYYSLLPRAVSERWLEDTPEDFRFDVKAFPSLTGHPVDVTRLPADLRDACIELGHPRRVYPNKLPPELEREIAARFLDFLEPLRASGRLGAIFLQFPPWFTATRQNARAIEGVRERYPELPFAIEFRHASWREPERHERVKDMLRAIRASYVCIDAPGLPPLLEVTDPRLAVLRFHGRNAENFARRGASVIERFDYLYVPSELDAFVEPLRRVAEQAEEVHAVFNNCVRNYAVLNAKDLSVLLERADREHPVGMAENTDHVTRSGST